MKDAGETRPAVKQFSYSYPILHFGMRTPRTFAASIERLVFSVCEYLFSMLSGAPVKLRELLTSRYSFQNELSILSVRILGDCLPDRVDAVYLFSQTRDNEAGQVEKAKELSLKFPHVKILICGEDGCRRCGWEGHERFSEVLLGAGIRREVIDVVPFPVSAPTINTLNESQALVEHLKSCDYKNLVLVSPFFHQVRSTITFLSCLTSACLCTSSPFAVYSSPAKVLQWEETVAHSQGTLKGTRTSFIRSESDRIWKYYCQGDLKHPKVILTYMMLRIE